MPPCILVKALHPLPFLALARDFHGGGGEGKDGNLSRSISNLSAEEMQLSQGAAAKRKGRFQIVDDPDAKVSQTLKSKLKNNNLEICSRV